MRGPSRGLANGRLVLCQGYARNKILDISGLGAFRHLSACEQLCGANSTSQRNSAQNWGYMRQRGRRFRWRARPVNKTSNEVAGADRSARLSLEERRLRAQQHDVGNL